MPSLPAESGRSGRFGTRHRLTAHVLAVSHAREEGDVLKENVAGYVYVTKVDTKSGVMTVLAPAPGALQGKYLLFGQLRWLGE